MYRRLWSVHLISLITSVLNGMIPVGWKYSVDESPVDKGVDGWTDGQTDRQTDILIDR